MEHQTPTEHALNAAALTVGVGVWTDYLPSIAASLTAIWMALQIAHFVWRWIKETRGTK